MGLREMEKVMFWTQLHFGQYSKWWYILHLSSFAGLGRNKIAPTGKGRKDSGILL
jgi:hypothetical protein